MASHNNILLNMISSNNYNFIVEIYELDVSVNGVYKPNKTIVM